ncbi:precorrin-6y C5,15-methyltransferase (decarboxylating) subunit CbiE [Pelagibacterium lacus]|uniref:Precorrin-6y C5,15-methyltransferase (Decarboxylating) subunit CbiE n=1 Tax=Pelagibacterium lacus TaxID=2282655 RepID=A0A369W4V7_9HYPH|nr:precorrin-6y C5,15-methyltransferase (decarboxylating) subunit CbiE [Pelagibacterium lacus]RDE08292.1 precorrin-6y C5,15-methyltransferase (decarboxylating) subunit CbiE [Pelagibacterium lacus]
MNERWLTIVGIGEDGLDGLTDLTKARIADAEVVFGGQRHLEMIAGMNLAEQRRWQSPIEISVEEVARLRGRKKVCVLASGDPFHFGIGATLARLIPGREMRVITSPSAFSLAAARMGWALQEVTVLSLHGRPIELVRRHLHEGRKILALTSDGEGPAEIAALLDEAGFGPSGLTVLEALGGPRERVRDTTAADFDLEGVSPLNVLAITVRAGAGARMLPLTPGLPDDWFDHDGQITKREVRALTLAALAPRRGETLWDIGAGSGSVAIEWMLMDPSLAAIAIEHVPERIDRIAENAAQLGVPGLTIRRGKAPEALDTLPAPDAIFIGGGGIDDGVVDAAIEALKPGGRLVANAVTLEMEALLVLLQQQMGGSLTRLQIARAETLGTMSGWRPAMPITQWAWTK